MSIRLPLLGLACALALVCVPSALSVAGSSFKVTSTLDGKSVLPHRIHWNGFATLPVGQLREIDFLIDGKVDWKEDKAPYTFADDGGYLVTSWLSPGRHRFAVRAIANDGRTATDTVVARVLAPPRVPVALAGTWSRTIADTSGAPAPGTKGNPTSTLVPPGMWRITFLPQWIRDTFPCTSSPCTYDTTSGAGGLFDDDWTPGAKTFSVQGEVTTHIFQDTDRLAGWWCRDLGPTGNLQLVGDRQQADVDAGRRARRLRNPRFHLGRNLDPGRSVAGSGVRVNYRSGGGADGGRVDPGGDAFARRADLPDESWERQRHCAPVSIA